MLRDDLVTQIVPILGRSLDLGFNVFDVMHHGTHEKQISNVFGWLLDVGGTHNLHDRFVRIFVDEVNQAEPEATPFPADNYRVRQEVNTSPVGDEADIADLVLDNRTVRLVIENYFTSDGHGHGYERYLRYSRKDGRYGAVVLLCRDEDRSRQSDGWENARVLTYSRLIDRLHAEIRPDSRYKRENPDVVGFIEQMHRKFVSERGIVGERDVLRFVTAMCDTGEAERYGWQRQEEVAERFASDVAVQARERFVEGRELLQRLKGLLRTFGNGPLREQLDLSLSGSHLGRVAATFSGVHQWTVNFELTESSTDGADFQLMFGPTAWFANEKDPYWERRPDHGSTDYSRVYVTHVRARVLRASAVTLQEVLDGLEPGDTRLHDAIIGLLSEDSTVIEDRT